MTVERVAVVLDAVALRGAVEVGHLSRDRKGGAEVVRFGYTDAWLRHTHGAFALDPELQLSPGDFFSATKCGLFGIFRDTSPDRWGRVLMERREALDARKAGRRARRLGEWDFLLGVSDFTRVGALRLRGLEGERSFLDAHELGAPPAARLRELQAMALALDEADSEDRPEYESWLRQLLAPGTSLGGARPKATFTAADGSAWLAKFPARQDRHDVGAWEFLAHELALAAKIQVPEARRMKLGGAHHTHAVKRFDRTGPRRRLFASAMTLLARNDGDAASYLDVAQAVQDQGDPAAIVSDLEELYRRVVFNVMLGNRDDHLRNHGFLRGPKGWRLSPAFDLNPSPDRDDHALALDGSTCFPSVATVRATRELYRLTAARAGRIEREVRLALASWQPLAKSMGIRRGELTRLEAIIQPSLE